MRNIIIYSVISAASQALNEGLMFEIIIALRLHDDTAQS